MEGYEKNDETELNSRDEIFSRAVRAGKRTYFFDVKATRNNDYYLTITESKKRFDKEGTFHYEKHKIFLYKEDFEKFSEGLVQTVDYIKSVMGDVHEFEHRDSELVEEEIDTKAFVNVEFEDLAK